MSIFRIFDSGNKCPAVAVLRGKRRRDEERQTQMLKEMIWHFASTDSSVIANMPENYDDYIERMDSAVEAYMRRTRMPDEEVFEFRRPDME